MRSRSDKRTTVSLAEVIWTQALLNMQFRGFNSNFSAYVADLIRKDTPGLENKNGRPNEGK